MPAGRHLPAFPSSATAPAGIGRGRPAGACPCSPSSSGALQSTVVYAAVLFLSLFSVLIRGAASRAEDPSGSSSAAGFVAGEAKPDGDGPMVQVPGGWMISYDERLPGSDVTFRMVPVPGGNYRMGSPESESDRHADEGPQFEVVIDPFWIGQHEVSWAEYKGYMAACDLFKAVESARLRPAITSDNEADAVTAPSNLYDPTTTFTHGELPDLPAVTMTPYAARQYTKWISLLTERFYRLPSEAEWEYACRAGTEGPWSCGDDPAALDAHAWFADNSDEVPHAVGSKLPNAFGIHDMHGNVAEWVVDQLVAGGYSRQAGLPQPVPEAAAITWPTKLQQRVVRGGSFYDEATRCRSAARRGSEDVAWKEVDPNLPKSPWWYTEDPALGVGMRVVRPFTAPEPDARHSWWNADIESIRLDAKDRLIQGRGARGIVDPQLPADARSKGITN
ncbi:MAG: formylglycine-generating enzyme family protein [Planctomycetota bacterium]|nr:MAG: formylglycine-generating enzyme family protein [Planctomycetota bacterium]